MDTTLDTANDATQSAVANTVAIETDVIRTLDIARLAELMRMRGYRVEQVVDPAGVALLRSATGGFAFEVRPGMPLPAPIEGFGDFTCHAALKVEGTLDPAILNAWNNTRRYARLHLHGDMLVLSQDISVLGGVERVHLFMQLEIWERQLQDWPTFLRAEIARVQASQGAVPMAAGAMAAREPAALAS